MSDLQTIQQQLREQLDQVDKILNQQSAVAVVPTEEQIYQMVDACVRKYLSINNFGAGVSNAIAAAINDADQQWLSANLNEMIPFLQSAEGHQVIHHVLQAYKIYKGYDYGHSTSTT
jgi:hypothetical protein